MTRRPPLFSLLPAFSLLAFVLPTSALAGDWPMWRGPNRDGVAPADEKAPLEWSKTKNIKWKVPVPKGNASPIVFGDRVFLVTALDPAEGRQRATLICFDRKDGKQLWQKTVEYPAKEPTHNTNPYSSASASADKDCVLAWHSSAGLYCYDHEGKELWKRDLGTFRHIWGWAGSPVIHGDVIFLNTGPGTRQVMYAINKKTGDVIWESETTGGDEKKYFGSWTTPRVVNVGGKEQVLLTMPTKVNGYDPKTGKVLWSVSGTGPLAYSDIYVSPPQQDGLRIGVALAGFGGPGIGFKIGGGEGDLTAQNRLWVSKDKNPQRIGTGVILGDHVVVPNEPNIGCYEIKTGKEVWKQQFQGERFWGSIIQVGDRLYLTGTSGSTYVFAADPKEFKLLAKNELGEPQVYTTPAVSNGQMFLRTGGHLWCVGEE